MNTLNVVESVFFAALEQETPEARSKYLEQACKGDDKLRQVVEKLLNAHPKAGKLMENKAPGLPVTIDHPPISEKVGTIIGPYKLLQLLGEGGFGVVFLAEQEQPIRRKVALKIIKPGMDSKQIVARFEAERQALALMDHPNIARVLDGGTTDSARPYFVMELVKGIPITEFCDKNRLTPKERLELFIPVCQAVQHAHQKGVIHRDLKPSNVLVTLYDDKPVPKVIDFGVAKAIEQKLTEQTLFTKIGQVVGTLEYMSPEQASLNALDVDTRADVYALGVLLYELLTGTTPHDKEKLQGKAFLEMLRIIREEEPPKPSTRLSQASVCLPLVANYRKVESQKLPKMVRGELDWIAMKAIEKDRARRYATANALAADVQRYLHDEQVEACPPSVSYRFTKYVRKHKQAFVLAGSCAALLILGTAASIWQAFRATAAERLANEARLIAEKARDEEKVQRELAMKEEAKTAIERDNVKRAREELRRSFYASSMALIANAWQSDNVARAAQLLEELRPKDGEEDLRNFEWHYWDRLCHAEKRNFKIELPGSNDANSGLGMGIVCMPSGDGRKVVYWQMGSGGGRPVGDGNKSIIRVADIATGSEIYSFQAPLDEKITFINAGAISGDGSRFAILGGRSSASSNTPNNTTDLIIFDISSKTPIFSRTTKGQRRVSLSHDGKLLAIIEPAVDGQSSLLRSTWKSIQIWDLSYPGKEPLVIANSGEGSAQDVIPNAPVFSRDGTKVAAITTNRESGCTIRIWDTTTGKERCQHNMKQDVLTYLSFSVDGKRLAATGVKNNRPEGSTAMGFSSRMNYVHVLDGAAGDQLVLAKSIALPRNDGVRPNFISEFSPDGKHLALSNVSSPVIILNIEDGSTAQTIKSIVPLARAIFSADGRRLITQGRDNPLGGTSILIQEWELALRDDARPVAASRPFPGTIWNADHTRQATYLVGPARNADEAGDVPVNYDITISDLQGKQICVYKKHSNRITAVEFSPDGRWVLSRSGLPQAEHLWNAATGETGWTSTVPDQYRGRGPVDFIATLNRFSTDGRWIILHEEKGTRVVSSRDLKDQCLLGKLSMINFSSDGKRMTVIQAESESEGPSQRSLKLWDVEAGQVIKTFPSVNGIAGAGGVRFSPDSKYVAVHSTGEALQLFHAATGELVSTISHRSTGNTGLYFSHDSSRIAAIRSAGLGIGRNAVVVVFEVLSGKELFRLEGHPGPVGNVVFSPDDKRIVSASSGFPSGTNAVKLWDALTGRELLQVSSEVRATQGIVFSPDGHRLFVTNPGAQMILDATPRVVAPVPVK